MNKQEHISRKSGSREVGCGDLVGLDRDGGVAVAYYRTRFDPNIIHYHLHPSLPSIHPVYVNE